MNYPLSVIDDILSQRIRHQYVKIELLNWEEIILEEITGIVKSGSYSENGSSAARRTLNLTFSTLDRNEEKIIDKLKASRKIKVQIGFKNTTDKSIVDEDILWFDLGIYIPVSVSLNHTVTNSSISLSCSDKMSLLNGTLGGAFPTPTTFAIKKDDGTYTSMSWRDIFINTASTIGGENPGKIIIENVPDIIRVVGQIKSVYGIKNDLIFTDAPKDVDGLRCIVDGWLPDIDDEQELKKTLKLHQGEKVYGLKKFAPPEPITINNNGTSQDGYIVNIGENVSKVFDDIVKQLNNAHQYYYDVKGNLILEPIHDYMVYEEDDDYYQKHHYDIDTDAFKPNFTRMPITYDYSNNDTVISYSNAQKFSNIRNDFVLSGENGKKLEIAIDKKITTEDVISWFKAAANRYSGEINSPKLDYCNVGVDKEERTNIYYKTKNENDEEIYVVKYPIIVNNKNEPIEYAEVELENLPWQIAHGIRSWHIRNLNGLSGGQTNQFTIENIYNNNQNNENYRWGYECEQLIYQKTVNEKKEWISDKGIFNLKNWKEKNGKYWKTGYSVDKKSTGTDDEVVDYTTPNFDEIGDSSTWNYWIDIIPDEGMFSEYSISNIGKRTYSTTNDACNMIFRTGYHDIVIIEEDYLNKLDNKEYVLQKLRDKKTGYTVIKNDIFKFVEIDTFKNSSTQNIEEPQNFIVDMKTSVGEPGIFQPTPTQKLYCGGYYNGSTDGVTYKDWDLTEISDGQNPPSNLLFFPRYDGEIDDVEYISPYNQSIKTVIPKNDKNYITNTNNFGDEEKTYGQVVAFPTNYPYQLPDNPSQEDKDREKNELESPLMLFYSKTKADNKLPGFEYYQDRLHPCFIGGRYNAKTKKFEYWGQKDENNWQWYEWIPNENDIVIGYAVNQSSNDISLMFNMEKESMSNIFSYNSDNDLFNSIMPIIVEKTNTADSVNINCLINPYLETNTLIRITDELSNVAGIYKINTISYTLEKATMTLGCTKMNKYLI